MRSLCSKYSSDTGRQPKHLHSVSLKSNRLECTTIIKTVKREKFNWMGNNKTSSTGKIVLTTNIGK